MTVSSKTVINKMLEQLRAAKECENHTIMINHISKVKVLSELLLDGYEEKKEIEKPKTFTPDQTKEIKATEKVSPNEIDEDETSIFDF